MLEPIPSITALMLKPDAELKRLAAEVGIDLGRVQMSRRLAATQVFRRLMARRQQALTQTRQLTEDRK